jgi:hypothetical protein
LGSTDRVPDTWLLPLQEKRFRHRGGGLIMPVSAWIMLVIGCLILYGGLAYCLALATGIIGNKKK